MKRQLASLLNAIGYMARTRFDGVNARRAYEEGVAISRALLAASPTSLSDKSRLQTALFDLAFLEEIYDNHDIADALITEAIELAREEVRADPTSAVARSQLSWDLVLFAEIQFDLGRRDAALPAYREGLQLARQNAEASPTLVSAHMDVVHA